LKLNFVKRLAILLTGFGVAAVISLVAAVFAAYQFAKPDLPEAATIRDIPLQIPLRVYSRDSRLIEEIGEQRRIPVAYEDIPPHVINAFLAAEDDRFFSHPGVDYQGILRAAVKNVMSGRRSQGASTITQQLARDYFLTRERSFIRKIREAFLAYKIEKEFTKEEILGMFLNKMFFGQRAYGVSAAAQVFFGKSLSEINVAEAATLAGTLQRPSRYNPVNGPEDAKRRRAYVLRRMRELNQITEAEYREASEYPLVSRLHGPDVELYAPYVAEMVRRELLDRYGTEIYSRGIRVTTTLDSAMQRAATYAVRDGLLEYDRRHGYRGPLETLDLDSPETTPAVIEQRLADFDEPGGLLAAAVTAIDDERLTAEVRLAGNKTATLPWAGMRWAKRHINADVVGSAPTTVSEILGVGDIVHVIRTRGGGLALAQAPGPQGALVALDPRDGAIAALTGGYAYNSSKFNRAIQARRQPGSAFKPFVYSAALENGFTASTVVNDAPVVMESAEYEGVWRPKNSSGRFYGPTRLRNALVRSLNLVSVRVLIEMGLEPARQHIAKFGFADDALPNDLSLALGSGAATPLDMARGYAVFANGGYAVEPYFIDRIETTDGELLYTATPHTVCEACDIEEQDEPDVGAEFVTAATAAQIIDEADIVQLEKRAARQFWGEDTIAGRAIDSTNAWLIGDMLRDVIQRGTGRRARALERSDLAGKTGTSNDRRDAWFAGFNPDLVAVSWVGFDNDQPLGAGEEGARTALPIWIHFMRAALDGAPIRRLPQPPGLVTVRINPETGELASANSRNAVFETFRVGLEPKRAMTDSLQDPFNELDEETDIDDMF
jgi:penicillin-binding protein 1A